MNRKTVYSLISFGLLVFIFLPLGVAMGAVSLTPPISAQNFPDLIKSITKVVAGLIGGLATIMIIIAGFFFLTSAGIPSRVEAAKKALFFAIVGIIIAIIAGPIVDGILSMLGATP